MKQAMLLDLIEPLQIRKKVKMAHESSFETIKSIRKVRKGAGPAFLHSKKKGPGLHSCILLTGTSTSKLNYFE